MLQRVALLLLLAAAALLLALAAARRATARVAGVHGRLVNELGRVRAGRARMDASLNKLAEHGLFGRVLGIPMRTAVLMRCSIRKALAS